MRSNSTVFKFSLLKFKNSNDITDKLIQARFQHVFKLLFHPTDPTENLIFGMELTWIVLITVCSLLIIFACFVGVAICLCRRNPGVNNNNGNLQAPNGNGNLNQAQCMFYLVELFGNVSSLCNFFFPFPTYGNSLPDKHYGNKWLKAFYVASWSSHATAIGENDVWREWNERKSYNSEKL